MKHIKSIFLTMLTALLALPASAQTKDSDQTRVLFEQNFEDVSNAEDTGWTFMSSMKIASDAFGKYLELSLGQNNGRTGNLNWGQDIFFENGRSLLSDGKYQIKYDFCVAQGSTNQYNGSMTVYTNHTPIANQPYRNPWSPAGYWQNYLFDMSQVNGESLGYAIDGGTEEKIYEDGSIGYGIDYSDSSTLEAGTWYTVTLDVNINDRTVDYSVVSLDGDLLKKGIHTVPQNDVNGDSISMYAEGLHLMLARYQTIIDIDNIQISTKSNGDLPPDISGGTAIIEGNTYEIKRSWDFARMTKEEGKKIGFPEFYMLNSSSMTGFNNWTARKRLYYLSSISTEPGSDGVPATVYPFGFVSDDSETNVLFYSVIDRSKVPNPSKDQYFNGLTIFPDKGNLTDGSLPNIGWIYHVGLYNDQAVNSYNNIIVHNLDETDYVIVNKLSNYGLNSNHPTVASDEEYYKLLEGENEVFSVKEYGVLNPTNNTYDLSIPLYRIDTACTKISVAKLTGSASLGAGDDFEYNGIWYTVLDSDARTCQTKAGKATGLVPGNTVSGQLTIPSVVKNGVFELSVEKIGNYSFCNLEGLTSVEIPESVISIGIDAFYKCNGLEKVTLPNSLMEIGNYAFNECTALTSITLPESLRNISNNVFGSCSSLVSISFPSNLTSIGEYAFSGCSNLNNLTLPDSLSTLSNGAFLGCRNLEKVFIPAAIKSMGYLVFGEATLIDSVKYAAPVPIAINTNNFDEFVYDNAILDMPNATLASIKGTSPWNRFGNIVAKDGTVRPTLAVDTDFEYEGIWYTVTNSESRLCKTKEGDYNNGDQIGGNNVSGDIVIPSVAFDGYNNGYTVVEIGRYSFCKNTELTSVFIPESVKAIETDAFDDCSNLSKAKFASMEALCDINFRSSSANPLYLAHNLYIGDEEVTEVVIPESVTLIKFCAFTGGSNLTSVALHNGVTKIDSSAFSGCSQLKSIRFSSSLTSIESDAFNDCKSLVSVNLPNSIKSIGNYAFSNCQSLTSVTIPAGITSIGNQAFYRCGGLSTVTYNAVTPITGNANIFSSINDEVYSNATLNMPNATLASVQAATPWNLFKHIVASDGSLGFLSAGEDFEYNGIWYTVIDSEAKTCKTKEGDYNNGEQIAGNNVSGDIVIPSIVSDGANEYTVTEIGSYSFCNCQELISVKISDGVIALREGAFYGCSSLNSVNIPDSVTLIRGSAFYGCSSLTTINIPDKVTSIFGSVFYGCSSLTTINIPDGLTLILPNAFYGCSSLTTINLPAGVTAIGSEAFSDCTSLISFNIPEAVTVIDGAIFSGCSSLTSIFIPEGVTSIGEYAFSGCSSLTSINIPEAVSSISAGAFRRCSNLTSINIPEAVMEIEDGVFYGCSSLASISLPDAVSSIGNEAFRDCSSLASINIPEGLVSIGNLAFTGCSSLASINIPAGVTSIGGYAFCDCSSLTSINIPDGITTVDEYTFKGCSSLASVKIPESVTLIDQYAFNDCSSLASINIPEGVTSIGDHSFSGCSSLKSINLPTGVTVIGDDAFANCSSLTPIRIPDGVMVIGSSAFANCSGLTSINIPGSVNSLGNYAFKNCLNLKEIIYSAFGLIEAPEDIFNFQIYDNSTLKTPNANLVSVEVTTPWNLFKHIVAKDGSVGFGSAGDDFEYNGVWYTVIDPEAKTCKTKEGDYNNGDQIGGNNVSGDIVIPSVAFDGYNNGYAVVEIGRYSFCKNTELTSVFIPESVKAIETDAFDDCSNLSKAKFASMEALCDINFRSSTSNPLYLAHNLYIGDEEVTEVVIPESVTLIKFCTFTGGRNLTSVVLHSGVTMIDGSAFNGCRQLKSIDLPSSLTSIGSDAFNDCRSLESVDLPNNVKTIDNYAFMDCVSLTSVRIPAGLSSIGYAAFNGCRELSTVLYDASIPITGNANIFSSINDVVYNNATLNMPNATLASVQATTPWRLFKRIVASDGSAGFILAGDEFEYDGLWYTVIDPETMTVKTKGGDWNNGTPIAGNNVSGDIVIPSIVSHGTNEFTVTAIGNEGFSNCADLLSVNIPESVTSIGQHAFSYCSSLTSIMVPDSVKSVGENAFGGCSRLSSLVWKPERQFNMNVLGGNSDENPNLLIYVKDAKYAPDDLDRNVVAGGVCDNLVLTQGYPFHPVEEFIANYSSMTKEFTQETPHDGCAGWETIVLPFDATSVRVKDARGELTPFPLVTDINTQYPYWLYEADSEGEWKLAYGIKAGVPYLISMPNNPDYEARYNINGKVEFSCPNPISIYPETASPYIVTWASGREFRSVWMPLDEEEAADAMGLNVGISDIMEDGEYLAPGSAFVEDVLPQPLEAYVTRNGSSRAFRISGAQSGVLMIPDAEGLKMTQDGAMLFLQSSVDRVIPIYSVDGTLLRNVTLKAGEAVIVESLPQGVCIIAGRKLLIK